MTMNFDLNQRSLGATQEERSYRHWCLRERLFLNPLNEAYTDSVAASDVLHLPSHIYRIEEAPTVSGVLQPDEAGIHQRPLSPIPCDP